VNGSLAKIGERFKSDAQIKIDGKIVEAKEKLVYILLNKPIEYVCTNYRSSREKNVFDLVDIKERLFVVGRLDKNSSGLLLLTNDGDFAYKLTHPSFQHEKEYEVTVTKELNKDSLEKMIKGVDIKEKTLAKAKNIKKIGDKKYNVILEEGKKRQIRRMFEVFNSTVLELKRTRIDKYKIGNIKEGRWVFTEKK
jgi:pseudouridine synthase